MGFKISIPSLLAREIGERISRRMIAKRENMSRAVLFALAPLNGGLLERRVAGSS
jgi:hypothetical protein